MPPCFQGGNQFPLPVNDQLTLGSMRGGGGWLGFVLTYQAHLSRNSLCEHKNSKSRLPILRAGSSGGQGAVTTTAVASIVRPTGETNALPVRRSTTTNGANTHGFPNSRSPAQQTVGVI